jgi:hypothetical protein
MLASPELLLPLAFSVSGLMIVVALVLLRMSARQSAPTRTADLASPARKDDQRRPKRSETLLLFSGATMAALEQATRPKSARKRQRVYS